MRAKPALGALLCALFALSPPATSEAGAQSCPLAPGCRAQVQQTIPFAATGLSLWGAEGTEVPSSTDIWLFDDHWDEADSQRGVQSITTIFGTRSFGGEIYGAASGRVGMKFHLSGYSDGSFDVDYPVDVAVTFPEPNTFRAGEAVTIETSWTVGDIDLDIDYVPMAFRLQGVFAMKNSAGMELCFYSCSGQIEFFPGFDIPETTFTMFVVEDGMWGVGDEAIFPPAGDVGNTALSFLTGISGTVNAPQPFGAVESDGTRLSAGGSEEFVYIHRDHDKYLQWQKVLPSFPPLGANVQLADYGAFDLAYETIDIDIEERIEDRASIDFDISDVSVRVDFPVELGYHVADASGTVTESGSATSATFPVGHDLTIYFPASVEPIELSPTFSIVGAEVERVSELGFSIGYENTDLALSLYMPQQDFSFSRTESRSKQVKEYCDDIDSVGRLADCIAAGLGFLWKTVTETFTALYNYTGLPKDIDLGPLYQEEFLNLETTAGVLDDSWGVALDELSGAAWTLDPEDPRISIETELANSLATGGTAGQVVQTITVDNDGDVPLDLTAFTESIGGAGLTVEALTSGDLTVNPSFDGAGDTGIGTGTIAPGGSGTVTLRVEPSRGLHSMSADVTGTSPIATDVSDATAASFGWYQANPLPSTLVRKGRGVVTLTIKGTKTLDVDRIDLGSIRWEGAAPRRVWRTPGRFLRARIFAVFDKNDLLAGLDARENGAVASVTGILGEASLDIEFDLTPPHEVAAALLGAGPMPAEAEMDLNGNGRLDLGDLRATLYPAMSTVAIDGTETGALGDELTEEEALARWGSGWNKRREFLIPHETVISGELEGGSPFWAETTIKIFERSQS